MHRITVVALALALALPATAAEKFSPDAHARAVAPFVDGQTVGVARVDLTRIDPDALTATVAEAGKLEPEEVEALRRGLRDRLGGLTRAGGKEVYAVFSMADRPTDPPFVVVPLGPGADDRALRRALGRTGPFEHLRFETLGGAVVGASENTLKRLRGLKPAPRPELAAAFAAAGDTAVQVLLLPTADTRRVIEELLPTLPPEVGGGPSRTLTRGLRWAALGADLPPKLTLRLVIQSADPAAPGPWTRCWPGCGRPWAGRRRCTSSCRSSTGWPPCSPPKSWETAWSSPGETGR
jgi:hypothetical protein